MSDARTQAAKPYVNLALDAELSGWVDFASALNGMSKTAYINEAIRRDMEGASGEVRKAFSSFLSARKHARKGSDA